MTAPESEFNARMAQLIHDCTVFVAADTYIHSDELLKSKLYTVMRGHSEEWILELVKLNPEIANRVQKFAEAIKQSADKPPREFIQDLMELLP